MTIFSRTIGYCFAIVFKNNRILFSLLFCNLKIPKQGIEMQIFFMNGLWKFLQIGHLPVKLHSSAPPGVWSDNSDKLKLSRKDAITQFASLKSPTVAWWLGGRRGAVAPSDNF